MLSNLDIQLPVGIAANKIKIIQAHQKNMWFCFKGGQYFYLLCDATFPAKKDWKFFRTKFSLVMLSPIMCYQSLFTVFFFFYKSTSLQYQHCHKALSRYSNFLNKCRIDKEVPKAQSVIFYEMEEDRK